VLAGGAAWPAATRLVVLVPAGIQQEDGLAARLYDAARVRQIPVLYLGLVPRPEDEPALRRRLALLAACTRDNHAVRAEYRLAVGGDWWAWLKLSWAPGDLIICHAEQQVRWLWSTQPLAYALAEVLGQPIVMLEGMCAAEPGLGPRLARRLAFWAGAGVFVAICFGLQVMIQHETTATMQPLLLALSVAAEFTLLAAWNKLMT
jgi:hypothetical protein